MNYGGNYQNPLSVSTNQMYNGNNYGNNYANNNMSNGFTAVNEKQYNNNTNNYRNYNNSNYGNNYNPYNNNNNNNNNNSNNSNNNNTNKNYPNTYYNSFNNNQNSNNPFRFNEEMNNLVRDNIKSRGNHQEIKQEDQMKKKIMLENIQQQMTLHQQALKQVKEKNLKEERKYLDDISSSYPFGRSGAGAPNRDKDGNVLTNRRRLISDPKYQHCTINVNDDYNEVWNTVKPGMMRFINSPDKMNRGEEVGKKIESGFNNFINNTNNVNNNGNAFNLGYNNQMPNTYNNIPSNNNNNEALSFGYNNNNAPNNFPNNTNNTANFGYNNANSNNNGYIDNRYSKQESVNYNNNIPINNYENNMMPQQQPYNNMNDNNPQNEVQQDFNNYYGNQNEANSLSNTNTNNNNFNNVNPNNYNFNPNPNNKNNLNDFNNNNTYDLSISYNNNDLNPEIQDAKKREYKNYLQFQMKEKEDKKKRELELKKQEEREEEERIRKEQEMLRIRLEEEENKKKRLKERIDEENKRLKDLAFNMNRPKSKKVEFDIKPTEQSQTQPSVVVYDPQGDEDLKRGINDQILRLKNQIQDQQMQVINQITDLKQETQQANLQRYEALKEISYLKEEISKTRIEDELRRKYVYDVMVDNKNTINTVMNNTRLDDNNNRNEMVYDKAGLEKKYKSNVKKIVYDDMIRYPKRPPMIPKIIEDGDVDIGGKSSFIDVDTYRVNNQDSNYEPAYNGKNNNDFGNDNFNNEPEYNKRAVKVENDEYIPLDGFYKNHDNQISQNLRNHYHTRKNEFNEIKDFKGKMINKNMDLREKKNSYLNNDDDNDKSGLNNTGKRDIMDVNGIYNKNLERLRWLNNIEELNS